MRNILLISVFGCLLSSGMLCAQQSASLVEKKFSAAIKRYDEVMEKFVVIKNKDKLPYSMRLPRVLALQDTLLKFDLEFDRAKTSYAAFLLRRKLWHMWRKDVRSMERVRKQAIVRNERVKRLLDETAMRIFRRKYWLRMQDLVLQEVIGASIQVGAIVQLIKDMKKFGQQYAGGIPDRGLERIIVEATDLLERRAKIKRDVSRDLQENIDSSFKELCLPIMSDLLTKIFEVIASDFTKSNRIEGVGLARLRSAAVILHRMQVPGFTEKKITEPMLEVARAMQAKRREELRLAGV